MKSYEYSTLNKYRGVTLYSTDPKMLDWILSELKRVSTDFGITGCKIETFSLPSGEKYVVQIHQLQGKDYLVLWWILTQLCHQGWEPFAKDETAPYDYHLRRENSEK